MMLNCLPLNKINYKLNAKSSIIYLGLAILIFLIHTMFYVGWCMDDPFITFRYARNFAEGNGIVFNVGERIDGYSNFLYVLIFSLIIKLGLDPVRISLIFGLISGIFTLILIYYFSRKYLSGKGLINYITLYLLAFNGAFAIWSVGLLETNFFTFLVLLSVLLFLKGVAFKSEIERKSSSALLLSAIVLFLLSITRPEGPIIFASLFITRFIIVLFNKEKIKRQDILWATTYILLYLIYFSWHYYYYGKPFPNSFYAKATGDIQKQVSAGIIYSIKFVLANGSILFLFMFFALLKKKSETEIAPLHSSSNPINDDVIGENGRDRSLQCHSERSEESHINQGLKQNDEINKGIKSCIQKGLINQTATYWYMFSVIIGYTFFIVYCGGDWMGFHRFFVPILPLIYLLIQEGAKNILINSSTPKLPNSFNLKLLTISIYIIIMLVIIVNLFIESRETSMMRYLVKNKQWIDPYFECANWMKENLPKGSTLAAEEAGVIPYITNFRFIDMFGLVDEHIARMPGGVFEKIDNEYVLNRKPDYILLHTHINKNGEIKKEGFYIAGRDMIQRQRFWDNYGPIQKFIRGKEPFPVNYMVVFKRNKSL